MTLLILALCLLAGSFVVSAILTALVPSAVAADTSALVSRDLLDHAGMKSDWQINLPLQKNESLGPLYIDGDFIYALTNKNYMFCIDRKKGFERFQIRLTNPTLPVHRPTFYDGKVIITVGTKLFVIDPDVGDVIERQDVKRIGKSTVYPAVRNAENYYIATSNKRLFAVNAEEFFIRFKVSADNDSLINSVIAGEENVIFATDSGNVVSIPFDSTEANWQTEIATGLTAPIVADKDQIFISSMDMKLYKLNAKDGNPAWKRPFQTGQNLTTSVRVGKDTLYQYAGQEGLYAIDRKTGIARWNLKKGYDLLAEQGSRAYVLAKPSTLYVMDNKNPVFYIRSISQVQQITPSILLTRKYTSPEKREG